MPKFYFTEALKLMWKTLPCVAAIVGAHFVFGVGVSLYYGIVLGLVYLTQKLSFLPFLIFVGGFGGSWAMFRAFKQYVLYVLKAGHIAVMAELLAKGEIPTGQSQLSWGKSQVTARFKEVSAMFVVDGLVKGVVATITGMVGGIARLLPVEAFQQLVRVIQIVVRKASEYIDEAILARAFILKDENVWKVAKDGTLLYAQAWKPILMNAAGLALISWASFPVFLVLFSPVGLVLNAVLPASVSLLPAVVVVALAYLGKASLGDTFALASTIATFHRETASLTPSPEWDKKLSAASDKFRELKARALGKEDPAPAAAPEVGMVPAV